MSESSIPSLKRLQDTLSTCREELGRLDIPKLKEALTKLGRLLSISKKIKGNEEAVHRLIRQTERLHQTTLAPILEAKRSASFSLSEDLRCSLCVLFHALDVVIPKKLQPSGLNSYFGSTDMTSVIIGANSSIEEVLNTFLEHGTIVQTQDYHLIQIKLNPEGDPTYIPQAGPSNVGHVDKLPSQVQRALDLCPRFRILLLGKSGAGKSSLINKVFGVSSAEIAHYQAGRAKIQQEHTSEHNPYFVLHDSMGFESGSMEQYKIVEEFIEARSKETELTEKIHAIWLCTAIPVSGGRVFESGDEQIFRLKLGNIPLIVVFTQYDTLVAKAELNGGPQGPNFEARVREKAEEYFNNLCVNVLKKICTENLQRDVPHFTKVSIHLRYTDTLSNLISLTHNLLAGVDDQVPPHPGSGAVPSASIQAAASDEQITSEADSRAIQDQAAVGITWAIAQRVDPITKIDAIIAIGRQRYWWGLASSFDFSGKSLRKCITVIHEDITQVWNFLDPAMYLASDEFKALMSKIVDDSSDRSVGSATAKLAAGLSSAAGLTGLLAAVAPPSVIVVGPIALAAVFAKWMYDAYQQTPDVIQHLMTYIVDTTLVMQRLFWLMRLKGGIHPVPEELVIQAAKEYKASNSRKQVHRAIECFVKKGGIVQTAKKGAVFAEIERLIRSHRFGPDTSSSS